ncbi:hypothetical protein FKW77_002503 [Venturia effusa]|uniref:Uncharacterized protein n=1 Tax=Venturia effusa TaxID=50376 RepID=A0A517LAI5_9PEZI|nr:hypothetical protein FKW77_002503 [Venturia effusa]
MTESPLQSSPSSSSPNSPRTPRKLKRKSDPFLELPDFPIGTDGSDQRTDSQEKEAVQGQNQSTLTKIIMTPLVFTSFLFSLLLVNHRYRAWRLSEHPPSNSSTFWSRISLRSWLDPEPYQDPSDTTWQHSTDAKGSVPHPRKEKWFTRKKHRKVALLEITEAFDMSRMMMVFMGIVLVVGALGVGWVADRALRTVVGLV